MLRTMEFGADLLSMSIGLLTILITAILSRILYMQKFHPLSKFPGPWYATSFSVIGAIISVKQREPEFLAYLVKKYGGKLLWCSVKLALILTHKDERPIRISPTMLLFPRPSALKDIYWDPKLNQKAMLYGSGAYVCPFFHTSSDKID
jgi:hypothetical protein